MQGNDKESKEMATRALRLQGSMTKTKPMYNHFIVDYDYREAERKKEDTMPKRGDFFHLKIYRQDEDSKFVDKSQTFKFKPKPP